MKAKKVETEIEKKSSLQVLCAELDKKYGAGTVISGKDTQERGEAVSTGSITLDIATDIGGYFVGGLIELYGPESSGKSTLTLHAIAEFQKKGKKCLLVDSEQSFDKVYATALGVDINELLISQPRSGEDGYNIIEKFVKSGEVGLIVLDSHTALVPKAVIDGEIGDAKMALQARLNSDALRKIHALLRPNNCTLIAIAQLRVAIGAYGDPNSPTGGLAYKFYSDMRLKVAKQVSKETHLNRTTVEVIKNKCGVPYGKAEFNIGWGIGIDRMQEVIDLSIERGYIHNAGAWFTVNENKVQGNEKVKEYLIANPEYYTELEKRILK